MTIIRHYSNGFDASDESLPMHYAREQREAFPLAVDSGIEAVDPYGHLDEETPHWWDHITLSRVVVVAAIVAAVASLIYSRLG